MDEKLAQKEDLVQESGLSSIKLNADIIVCKPKEKPLLPSEVLLEVLHYFSKIKLDALQIINRTFDGLIRKHFKTYPKRVMTAALVDQDNSCLVVDQEGRHTTFSSFEHLLEIKNRQNVLFLSTYIYSKGLSRLKTDAKVLKLINPFDSAVPQFFVYGDATQLPVQLATNGRSADMFRGRVQMFHLFYTWIIEMCWPPFLQQASRLPTDALIRWLQFSTSGTKNCPPKRFFVNTYAIIEEPEEFEQRIFNYFEISSIPFEIIIGSWGDVDPEKHRHLNRSAKNFTTNQIMQSIVSGKELADNPDYEEAVWVLRSAPIGSKWQSWWSVDGNAEKLSDWLSLSSLLDNSAIRSLRFCELEQIF